MRFRFLRFHYSEMRLKYDDFGALLDTLNNQGTGLMHVFMVVWSG